MTPQEQSLIAGCVRGEKAAWDAFVEQYAKLVYHTIKITANFRQAETPPDFADDLFQEIFLTLVTDDFAQLRRFRGDNGCTLASWLRMIAARRTIDHLRKHRHRTELVTDAHGNQQDNPELAASEGQLHESLARALESLTAHERILIKLFYTGISSASDVASMLHLSVGAVYTQKSRILAKLRETLEKAGSL